MAQRVREARRYLFDRRFLTASLTVFARAGAAQLRAFIKSDGYYRVSFPETVAIVAYLESRRGALEPDVRNGINKLYAAAFIGALLEGDLKNPKRAPPKSGVDCVDLQADDSEEDDLGAARFRLAAGIRADGAMFQLSQTAVLDIASQATGSFPLKEIEGTRKVPVVINGESVEFLRYVDIVLKGADNETVNERWVETKSYASSITGKGDRLHWSKVNRKWNGTGKTIPHRQFYIDRVHAGGDTVRVSERMLWLFHDFTAERKGCAIRHVGLSEPAMPEVRGALARDPVGHTVDKPETFGIKDADYRTYAKWFGNPSNLKSFVYTSKTGLDKNDLKAFLPVLDELVME